MLYREVITDCSEIYSKQINVSGQNAELLTVKSGGVFSNHWTLKEE